MEPRIAKLEASFSHMERDVAELRTDMRDVRDRLTRIETRVDHLPTKGFIVTSVVVTLAVMTALITFQDRVQRLVRPPSTAATTNTPLATTPSPSP